MRRSLLVILCGSSVLLGAEVITHPDRCKIAFNRFSETVLQPKKKHSAETIRKWKEWGASHPGWRSKKETLAAFDFACQVEPETVPVLSLEPTPELDLALGSMEPVPDGTDTLHWDIRDELTDDFTRTDDDVPGSVVASGGYPLVYSGFTTPVVVSIPTITPEPTSLALFGSGLLGLFFVIRRPDDQCEID